jgi:hypothetical protein
VWFDEEGCEVIRVVTDMCVFESAHHDVHAFIEFGTSGRFPDRVTDTICSGNVCEKDKFFFCPLQDTAVTHVDVSCPS